LSRIKKGDILDRKKTLESLLKQITEIKKNLPIEDQSKL